MNGCAVNDPLGAARSTWSSLAPTNALIATRPSPPGRFSTTTGWPQRHDELDRPLRPGLRGRWLCREDKHGEKGDAKCKTLHAQQWDLRCHDPRRRQTPAGKPRLPKGVAHHVELVNDSTLRLKTLRAPMPADGGGGAGPSLRGPKARRPDCGRGDRYRALAAGLSLASMSVRV